mmetsp:Transcript_166231/g.294411  ORF Transcript_166231/g.294411 Transcript_166231/m.294411 type:complete len:212 (+) Transcript_166231:874-1509(+)
MASYTLERPGCLAAIAIKRPSRSCETKVSTLLPPTSFTKGAFSASRISAMTCPRIPCFIPFKASKHLKLAASASSAAASFARRTMAFAVCALTLTRSLVRAAEPERNTTVVPSRCFGGSTNPSSSSISSLPKGARTTTTPPFSLSLAIQSSWTRWMALSFQPRINTWSLWTTFDLPCLKASIFSRRMSTIMPSMAAKKIMPPTVMKLATMR